ncbi:MAG TPA: cyclase family protein [Terriglobia bacterium]|nr:cyclase family protein [Terriglobia bacterium]
MIDLSQPLEEHMPRYPTHSRYYHHLWSSYQLGDRSLTYQLLMNEHNGTHVDAPAHFISESNPEAHVTIDGVPLARLIGRGVRLDCRRFRAGESVEASFVAEWERNHVRLEAGDVVLFNFGWDTRWALRPHDGPYVEGWPGVSVDAARYLLDQKIAAVGVDTLSPDAPEALRTGPIHPILLERQVLIVENLCRLDELPDTFLFIAIPLKIRGGSGSPVRAVALY